METTPSIFIHALYTAVQRDYCCVPASVQGLMEWGKYKVVRALAYLFKYLPRHLFSRHLDFVANARDSFYTVGCIVRNEGEDGLSTVWILSDILCSNLLLDFGSLTTTSSVGICCFVAFFFSVPGSNRFHEEPSTPVGRAITGAIENNANRTPPSALAVLVISPGSLPAKRLYSDVWKEPPTAEQGPRSRSKNRLSFSRFVTFLCSSGCRFNVLPSSVGM